MKYRTLGKTGLKVSVVGVGTWQFGGEWGKTFEQGEVDRMFAKAADCGINLIDTAECYGDHTSEAFVGKAIKGQRDQWIVATKFGHKFNDKFERDFQWSPDAVRRQLEDSLEALQTDHVDLYQFHSGDNDAFQTPGLWETLREFKQTGKVRHLGISVSGDPQTHEFQISRADDVGAEAIQIIYNRLDRRPEEDGAFDLCIEKNLGVLARVPLASGYLSGKYTPDDADTFADDDVRGKWHGEQEARRKLQQAEDIKRTEVPDDVPMAEWALGWCLKHPAVTCVIPGCKNEDQVASNAAAAELALVPDNHPQAAS